MTETRSTCPYCGVGCGLVIQSEAGQITGVRGDPEHPANFGRLCTKGSTLHLSAAAAVARQTRLLQPMRRPRRSAAPVAIGWDAALDHAAGEFARVIAEHGPDAVGFYVSGQLLTEDYYVFNKLAKGLVGTNNIDTNSRLCMSSAVAAYKKTLGADAPPACYEDIAHAQCLFIVGSNAAWTHPVLFRRIEDAKAANPALRIVVVDPRRTDTAEAADLFLRIAPGSDVMLAHGMLHAMLREGWTQPAYIARHTTGFEALAALVRDCPPEHAARVCGIDVADLVQAARWFASSPATLSLYCQGLNQSSSGTAKNAALINLHLATAQIGRPGAGPFSLTGQPNAMGGREVGALANQLGAHRELANATHRAEVAALWGVPEVPARPGKAAVELFEAAADGEVRALWIACTNPAQSMPDQTTVRRALQRCEFVVVQEAFASTASCDFADLLLPASTWGEKEGTVTNSERRISRVRAAVAPPGQARADWAIAVDFARRLEARWGRTRTLFPYDGPEAIWNEHRACTRGRDLDITGLSYAMLEAAPRQWPLREGDADGRARLYEDGVFATADGRARFDATPWRTVAEPCEPSYPLALNTGRLRDQWHGMSRTGNLGRLFGHTPEPALQMHPRDMARRALAEGDLATLRSRRGAIVLPAQASDALAPGQVFLAMHWGAEFLMGHTLGGEALAGVNTLTTPARCPDSLQPEFKHAAVQVLKAELPWQLRAAAWLPAETLLTTRAALRPLLAGLPFASCVPFADAAGERSGLLLRAAAGAPADDALLAAIETLLGLAAGDTLRYADARRGQRRALRFTRDAAHGQARLDGFLLAGDTRAEAWMRALLQEGRPTPAFGAQWLRPGAHAPQAGAAAGRQVCLCLGVGSGAIEQWLAGCDGDEAARLAALQRALGCGTRCGSCLPELRRLVRTTPSHKNMPATA